MISSPTHPASPDPPGSDRSRPAPWFPDPSLPDLVPPPGSDPGGPRRPMVGRDRESSVLAAAMAALIGGAGRIVELAGEPGIGKSDLLERVAGLARERGITALAGRAPAPGSGMPMAALVNALDGYLAGLPPARLATIRPDHADLLNGVFSTLHLAAARSLAPAGTPYNARRLRAVRILLETLTAERPLLITLDDLHNSDQATIDLICHLLDAPPRTPLLLVLAHRRRQSPARLRLALDTAGHVTRLALGPLAECHIDALTTAPLSAGQRRVLYELSGGNPRYLWALLASALPHGPTSEHVELGALAPDVESALGAELELLSSTARLVTSAAAVLGPDPVDAALLAEVGGVAADRVPKAIDELVAADLLRPVAGTGCFAFRHRVVQHAAYLATDPGWRLTAHARALAALHHRGAAASARAPHVLCLAVPGDLAAVDVLSEAAASLLDRAPGTAVRWLGTGLRLLPTDAGTTERRIALSVRLGRALGAAGHPRAARAVLHEVLRLLSEQPSPTRTAALLLCAQLEGQLGRREEARALLRAGLATPNDGRPGDRAALALALGGVELTAGRVGKARRWAAAALGAARRAPLAMATTAVRAHALGLLAAASHLQGHSVASGETDQAAALLDATLDGELSERPESAVWVGWSEILLGRFGTAARHLSRAVDVSRGAGRYLPLLQLLCARMLAYRCSGRLADAAADCTEALRLASNTQCRELHYVADATARLLDAWTGKSCAGGATAHPGYEPPAAGWLATLALSAHAEARLAAGDVPGCLAAASAVDLSGLDRWSQIGWYEMLTRASLAAADQAGAAQWAGRAHEVAGRLGQPGRTALAASAGARVLALHDPTAAVTVARSAAAALAEAHMPLDAARAHVVTARALAAGGDRDRAGGQLRLAEDLFEQCGAGRFAREVNTERRRLLASGSFNARKPRHQAGPPTLTRRETQVASLVSEGLTNREVAARLFVTQKTVEMHLSRVFSKLGVTNRAALVRRFHLAGPPHAPSS
nr:AAA family ATPase [Micromonospora sp. DSM 115978]